MNGKFHRYEGNRLQFSPYLLRFFSAELIHWKHRHGNCGRREVTLTREENRDRVKNLEEKRNRTEPEKDPIRQYR